MRAGPAYLSDPAADRLVGRVVKSATGEGMLAGMWVVSVDGRPHARVELRALAAVGLIMLGACGGSPPPPTASAQDPDARLGGGREVPRANTTVQDGEAKLAAGDAAGAKAAFEAALQQDPSDPRAHLDLGLAHEMLGDPTAAEQAYRKAIELQPDLAEALNNLGVLLRARGEVADAIALLRRAAEANAESASAHMNLALALEDAGDREAASQAYARAVALAPEDAMTRVNYGLLLLALGQPEAGEKQLLAAREHAAGNRAALLAIGNGLRQTGRSDDAVAALSAAIEAGDGKPTPALLSELALAQRAAGNRTGAIESLEAALALDKDYATAHYLVGNLLAADKRFRDAQKHYERYLALAPDGPQADRARERLTVIKKLK